MLRRTRRQRLGLQRASRRAPRGARTVTRVKVVRMAEKEPAVRTRGKGLRRAGRAGGVGVGVAVGEGVGVGVGGMS
jgi:hypothetical protein